MSKQTQILFALLLFAGPAFGQLPSATANSKVKLTEGNNTWFAPVWSLLATLKTDSTFALAPGGGYGGKRITSNVYREGKLGLFTKDTTAAITYRIPSPDNVNGFAPVGKKVLMPPRSSFSHPTWVDGSRVWLEQIDPNNMRPAVDTAFKFGLWEDIMVIDSLTNSEVNRPGDLIRDVGFNLSGASTKLARWGWSTEQYYYPGVRDGENMMDWEHHLQVRDTIGRFNRPFNLNGAHSGKYYGAGFVVNDYYVAKPFSNRRALNINTTTGEWYSDAPFSFRLQKDTFTSLPLFSKLYSGSYRNLLNMHTNGRTDIGDVFGTRVTDSLSMYASSGAAQAFKITGLGPSTVKWEGKIAQESNLAETYTLTRVGNTNRMSFSTAPGNEYGIGINGNSSIYFRGAVPATRMTFLSDGNISVNGFASQTQFAIFQPSLDRAGGIRLNPVTSGNVADIFVNASNEMVIQRTSEALRLANSGQLQLPEYTSSTAFPLTPVATAVFGSDGKIGTAAYSPLAGTGTANRVAYWSGTNNITSSANFLFDGTKVSANTGTAISTYLSLNPSNNASSTALNGGLTLFDNGTNNLYGMDMGYGASFGPRLFTAADINFAKVTSGSAPTVQSDFENIMTIKGGTSRVGIGTTGPSEKLHVVGNTLTEGRATVQSTGTNAALYLNNTTASTGKNWYINSGNAGSLFIGNPTSADAITINGTTGATTIANTLTINTATGTATTVTGRTSAGVITDVAIGSGLSLSGGTLSATGGGGGNYQTFRDDGTGMTQRAAANYISTGTVAMALTDDAGNNETEIRATIPTGAVGDTELASTGVTAATYTNATISVNANGRITSAANGNPTVVTATSLTADADNLSASAGINVLRVSGDNGIRGITSISATGMPDGQTFRIVNTGTQPLVLQAQHPDATSGNEFLGPKDVFLPGGQSVTAVRDATADGFWVDGQPQSGQMVSSTVVSGSPTAAHWGSMTFTTGGGAITFGSDGVKHGYWTVNTAASATANPSVSLGKSIAPTRFGQAYLYSRSIVRIPTLSDGSQTFKVFTGFTSTLSLTDSPLSSAGIHYTSTFNSGKWYGYSSDAGAVTTVDLGITVVANTTYVLETYSNLQRTEVRYFVDGVYRGRSTTNMPASEANVYPLCGILKQGGTTTRAVYVTEMSATYLYPN